MEGFKMASKLISGPFAFENFEYASGKYLMNRLAVFTATLYLGMSLPLFAEESASVPFSVLTYNIENGGAQVSFDKTVEVIKKSGADVVGLQEAWGNTGRLAKEVGWEYYDPRQHIISRFPLLEAPDSEGLYLLIEVKPGKFVAMANVHLPDEPYGPDMVRAGS